MANKPLQNRTILITRAEEQGHSFAEQVVKLGGTPIVIPLIAFQPAHLSILEQKLLVNLHQFHWIIFTSVKGVEYFFKLYETLNDGHPSIQSKFAVVGKKTKEALVKKGYSASVIPSEYVAEGLLRDFQNINVKNEKMLYIKGNLSRNVIPDKLKEQGANVSELIVYETICPPRRQELTEVLEKDLDVITFTSPSTIKHFVDLLEGAAWQSWIQGIVVCCIGPITEKSAREYGMVPEIIPSTYTMEYLLQELVNYFQIKEERT
jgi:uroporphyrinogen-III synthase